MELSDLSGPYKLNVKDFLIKLAELADGEIRRRFSFDNVWSEMNRTRTVPLDASYFKDRFIPLLGRDGLIKIHNTGDISITYDGVYSVASWTNRSIYNFNLYPIIEVEQKSKQFLTALMDFINQTRKREVTITEFKQCMFPKLNYNVFLQMSDHLANLGLIKQREVDQEIFISIPSKSVRPPSF